MRIAPERRVLATGAALGLLAGGLLLALLRLLAGPRVTVGLGWLWHAGSPAYPYRLLDAGGAHPDLLPLVPVVLGAGLLAGVLVAFGVGFLRGPRLAVWPPAGLVVGLLVALGAHTWRWNAPVAHAVVVYHGRYVPSAGVTVSQAYSSTLDIVLVGDRTWWPLVVVGASVGLLAGVVVAALPVGRLRGSTSPSG